MIDHWDSLAASSILPGLQQKTPDDGTWCDSVAARWADGDLQIEAVLHRQIEAVLHRLHIS